MITKLDFAASKFDHKSNIDDTEKFLGENPLIHDNIDKLIWAYHEIGHVIPQYIGKLGSGHNFPYSESFYEIECSYQLSKLSFYKFAFIALRNAFELGLLSVYWDREDNSEILIQDWHNSKEDTPFKRKIVDGLKSIDNIQTFNKHFDLIPRIDKIYGDLSDFSHTKGYSFSGQNLNHANFTRFNNVSFLSWVEQLKKVIQLLLTIHVLKYPVAIQNTPIQDKFGINGPFGGFLDIFQSDNIKEVLPEDELGVMQSISDNYENAKSLADWVNSHPDITEEEYKKQIEEFDEFMSEHNFKDGNNGNLNNNDFAP